MKSDATKVAMSNALKGLLKKKKLSKITINDIASECNISRMTFYYHGRWKKRQVARLSKTVRIAAGSRDLKICWKNFKAIRC